MSAETLRRAAALMRERAEAAPSGERWVESDNAVWRVNDPHNTSADALTGRFPIWADGAAEHIASWHPSVALAVAHWLETAADRCDEYDYLGQDRWFPPLTVARAYLGGDA